MLEPPRYVACDLEGTLTTGEVWRGLARYLATHGRSRQVRLFLATHYPGALLVRAGLLDKSRFKLRWMMSQTRLLAGYRADEIDALAEWVVEREEWPGRRAAVVAELQAHHSAGCTILFASGQYDPILLAFARRLGLERVIVLGSALEYAAGRATGRLVGDLSIDAVKADRVREIVGPGVLDAAYGDTAADAMMLALSRAPVAVSPDAMLEKIAKEKGWRILSA